MIDLSLFYYLFNAHGDMVQRVATQGHATPFYEYDAFGNLREHPELYDPDKDPNPFRYCGEYWDADIEEVYLRARTYNPANGRFATQDPAFSGNNWYRYCLGNPVNNTDPTGKSSDPIFTEGWTDMYWKKKPAKKYSSDPTFTPGWTDMYWSAHQPQNSASVAESESSDQPSLLEYPYPLAVAMYIFAYATNGLGETPAESVDLSSDIIVDSFATTAFDNSWTIDALINEHIDTMESKGEVSYQRTGTTTFYGTGNAYDNDLHYAFGTIDYTINITKLEDGSYDVTIHTDDKYEFYWLSGNEYGSDSFNNTFGFIPQWLGLLNEYYFSYTYETTYWR